MHAEKLPVPSRLAIARQAIVDESLRVFGYELLFRAPGQRTANLEHDGGDLASSLVVVSGFIDGGAYDLVGDKVPFINVSPEWLASGAHGLMSAKRVVLEISADDVARMQESRLSIPQGAACELAIDHFDLRPSVTRFLAQCRYIKVDLLETSAKDLRRIVEVARQAQVEVIGTRIETREDFDACRELGMTGFQGYFLCRPVVVANRDVPGSSVAVMQLLQKLWAPDMSFGELEAIIRRDVALAYRLLRVANSPFYGRGGSVKSIKQALQLLGADGVRQWGSLLSMSQIPDRPSELFATSLIRARMLENLAKMLRNPRAEQYFLVGLLSVVDALLEQRMEDVVERLGLSEDVKAALLTRAGSLGDALTCAKAQEEGRWEQIVFQGLDVEEIQEAYLEAIRWSREVGGL